MGFLLAYVMTAGAIGSSAFPVLFLLVRCRLLVPPDSTLHSDRFGVETVGMSILFVPLVVILGLLRVAVLTWGLITFLTPHHKRFYGVCDVQLYDGAVLLTGYNAIVAFPQWQAIWRAIRQIIQGIRDRAGSMPGQEMTNSSC